MRQRPGKPKEQRTQHECEKGQGVVEYAGALVMAAVLVSLALVFPPNILANVFSQLITSITTFLTSSLP